MEQAEFAEIRALVRPLAKLGAVLADAEKLVDGVQRLNMAIGERTRQVSDLNAAIAAKTAEVEAIGDDIVKAREDREGILAKAQEEAKAIVVKAGLEGDALKAKFALETAQEYAKAKAKYQEEAEIAGAKFNDVQEDVYAVEKTLIDLRKQEADARAKVAERAEALGKVNAQFAALAAAAAAVSA